MSTFCWQTSHLQLHHHHFLSCCTHSRRLSTLSQHHKFTLILAFGRRGYFPLISFFVSFVLAVLPLYHLLRSKGPWEDYYQVVYFVRQFESITSFTNVKNNCILLCLRIAYALSVSGQVSNVRHGVVKTGQDGVPRLSRL